MKLNTVEELITDIRMGKMVILMDDEDRENEGDLVMAATHTRPEDINFMVTHARGLVCLTLTEDRCNQLNLPLMVQKNGAAHGTNFTVSIEAAEGVTTGISAADRARTIQAAVAPYAKPSDITQPGHIFPLKAQSGGVLHRAGHTEAGCDLTRLAGLEAAAVIVEIMNEDGSMARRTDLEKFAQKHNLKIGTIADLIHYRMLNEQTVKQTQHYSIKTDYGNFEVHEFLEQGNTQPHIAIVKGQPHEGVTTVRVHSFEPFRDLLAAHSSKPSWSTHSVLKEFGNQDRAVLIMMAPQEPVGFSKTTHTNPTINATSSYRSIGVGAQILRELGVKKMRLLSSLLKFNALSGFDLEVIEYVAPSF